MLPHSLCTVFFMFLESKRVNMWKPHNPLVVFLVSVSLTQLGTTAKIPTVFIAKSMHLLEMLPDKHLEYIGLFGDHSLTSMAVMFLSSLQTQDSKVERSSCWKGFGQRNWLLTAEGRGREYVCSHRCGWPGGGLSHQEVVRLCSGWI